MLRELACGGVAVARRFAAQVRALTRGERLGDAALSSGNVWARPAHECGRQLRAVLRTLGFAAQGCRYRSAVLRRLRDALERAADFPSVFRWASMVVDAVMLCVRRAQFEVFRGIVALVAVAMMDERAHGGRAVDSLPHDTVLKWPAPLATSGFYPNVSIPVSMARSNRLHC